MKGAVIKGWTKWNPDTDMRRLILLGQQSEGQSNKNPVHHCRKSKGQKYCEKKSSAAETVVSGT